MGNNTIGSTRIAYTTRDRVPVDYIYYDLKGKNRFPTQPASDREIQLMFEKCLKEIQATPEQLEIIRDFNEKYKFRFVVLHQRKVQEYKEHSELSRLRQTQKLDEGMFKGIEERRKKDLDEKLLLLESNQTALRMHLGAVDRYISEKNAWTEFIKINGIERLVFILDKAILANKQGTKTIFQNQIQILKFLKSLCDHNPKEYFQVVATIPDYPIILLRAYHPVNVSVTAYVLLMLQDYSWKVESASILATLRRFQEEGGYVSFLQPFAETIFETNNILMCYYNLRFVNEVLISIVDDTEKQEFMQELHTQRYDMLIEDVKTKLQDGHFNLQACTFQAVSQQIYKYATRSKQGAPHIQQALANRTTTNLAALQQHLLVNFVQNFIDGNRSSPAAEEEHSENDDDYITVLLIDGDKKSFNKFMIDTFDEIKHYYKYTIIVDEGGEGEAFSQAPQVDQIRKYGLSCEEYVKRIKGSCLKNACEDVMLNCLKSLQYFEKAQWRRLESYLQEEMRTERTPAEAEVMRRQLEEKDRELKQIKKDFYQLKTDVANMSRIEQPKGANSANVSKLDMTLFQLDKLEQNKGGQEGLPLPKKLEIPPGLLPPPLGLNTLPGTILPPPPPPPGQNSLNIPILPPPPSLGDTLPTIGSILPPPPPPPSGLSFGGSILPPPPSLGNTILPPPPSLGYTILPPPPSLGNVILPPPPSLGNTILPPPPSLGDVILPPPPSLGGTILPPPPSLPGIGLLPPLPPPPMGLPGLPPPPPLGLPGLPPPPPIGGLPGLPPPPGLPGLPGLPPLGGIGFSTQKQKQKCKPSVNLKACNYKTMSYNEIEKTVWSNLDDSNVPLDKAELQSLFARAAPKELPKVQSAIQISAPKKKQPVKLLGSDRWRNMEIVLTKLKMPEGAITQALTTCSGKYAVPSVLQSVKSLMPSEEEEANVSGFDGDIEDLGKPQRFLKELIAIPEYANRVKSILFNGVREELYFDIQKNIEDLTIAFESLRANYRLHYVLQVSLAVGNYLNGTGLKGGAWGFKLDTLQRLQQVKSQDNKMNAGLYIIKQVWKKFTYPIFSKEQVDMYQFISKMPISQIKVDLAQLKKYAIAIEKAFNSKMKNNQNDRIDEHCEEILLEVKSKYEQLSAAAVKLDAAYTDCATFYCQDPTKAASDEVGKKLFKSVLFIFNTEKIYYELEERRKKEEARKAVKNQVKFKEDTDAMKKKDTPPTINPQTGTKLPPPSQSGFKLPMPSIINPVKSNIVQITASQRLKQLQKTKQEREKKFLQQMMKKRNSKMVAFRQSKATGGVNIIKRGDPDIDFLKGL